MAQHTAADSNEREPWQILQAREGIRVNERRTQMPTEISEGAVRKEINGNITN